MLDFLRRPVVIMVSFLATIALVFGFMAWQEALGTEILDRLASVDETTALLGGMTDAQKSSHFWMTLVLDYAFPVTYGSFFAGLALRFPGKTGLVLAVPAFLVFGADVVENTVQLAALKGIEGPLVAKEFLTPAKFLLFNAAALIALASVVWLAAKRGLELVQGSRASEI